MDELLKHAEYLLELHPDFSDRELAIEIENYFYGSDLWAYDWTEMFSEFVTVVRQMPHNHPDHHVA